MKNKLMKDGYYLSTYLHINEMAYIEDIFYRHDQNFSLWRKTGEKIELIHYWELERLTGMKKHWRSFYSIEHARTVINELLAEYGITIDDCVEVWGTPLLQTTDQYHALEDYPKLEYHGINHLFSALLSDTDLFHNEVIISLELDGGPDKVLEMDYDRKFFCGCVSNHGRIEQIFPISSPGPFWNTTSNYLKLREGTLMALATACNAHLLKKVEAPDLVIDDLQTIKHKDAEMKKYLNSLYELVMNLQPEDEGRLFTGYTSEFTLEENRISILMKEIHETSIHMVVQQVDDILKRYHLNSEDCCLALSGGYALNCPTNTHLMQKYKFKKFISVPNVSDTGISLGIALYAFYKRLPSFNFKFMNAYYGNVDRKLKQTLELPKYNLFIKSCEKMNVQQCVEDIQNEPCIWFDGRSEIGPRALGHRSLIADPSVMKSKNRLNEMKQRQWWRPVAPIILEEDLDEWFEDAFPSPYMLHNFQIKESKRNLVPAIIHLDGSARVQTLTKESDSALYDVISAFKEKTGIPIICNTSLNDLGEPIIDTIEECLNFALRKNVKVVYVNQYRIELCQHQEFKETEPAKRRIDFMNFISDQKKEEERNRFNPFHLSEEVLNIYYNTKELKENFSIDNQIDIKALMKLYKKITSTWYWDV